MLQFLSMLNCRRRTGGTILLLCLLVPRHHRCLWVGGLAPV